MRKIRLGRTELMVSEVSFGALPVQRVPRDEAVRLIRRAYEGGVSYFDTANAYTDSEEKLGLALSGARREVVLSTKSMAKDKAGALAHIEESLRRLKTDYIDLFQLHNPGSLPDPDDADSALAAAREAKRKGYVRHIGVTSHRLAVAREAVASGLYDTLQFPFSYLASEAETELVALCREKDMGFIAMKALAGGLLTNAEACAAFMRAHPTAVPIWGIQRESELDQFLALAARDDLALTPEFAALIERDRRELSGNFCRGCGYCLPCPAGIDIPMAARMDRMLRRAPTEKLLSPEYRALMHRIEKCTGCRACASRCPYGLDTPNLLKAMLADYDAVYLGRGEG